MLPPPSLCTPSSSHPPSHPPALAGGYSTHQGYLSAPKAQPHASVCSSSAAAQTKPAPVAAPAPPSTRPCQPPPSQSRTVPVIQLSPPKLVHPHPLAFDTPSSSDGSWGHHHDPKLLPPPPWWVCQACPHHSPGAHLRTTLCPKTLWHFPEHHPSCFTQGAAACPAAAQSLSQAQVPFLADLGKF